MPNMRIFAIFTILLLLFGHMAHAQLFDIENLPVSIQSQDAVTARDKAILQAQRLAFAQLTGQPVDSLKRFTDSQIARLIKDFSIRNERLAARFYSATYKIRFDPARTGNFIHENGLQLIEPEARVAQKMPVATAVAVARTEADGQVQQEIDLKPHAVAVLPVLDLGSRRMVWDEPNPWRDMWQKSDYSTPELSVRVPLGDAADMAAIPDAGFIDGGVANVADILKRYGADALYVIVARSQDIGQANAGMSLSLYRHDGTKLSFLKKTVARTRPGFMFDDAVPVAVKMLFLAQNNQLGTIAEEAPKEAKAPVSAAPVVATGGTMSVVVPYQSLQQWVSIQSRLRRVPGISNVLPIRVSPSSAQVRLMTTLQTTDLASNLSLQGFELQQLPSGESVLMEK